MSRLRAPAACTCRSAGVWNLLMRASTLLVLVFQWGCAEQGAMPTGPESDLQDIAWQRSYPPVSAQDLRAAWGCDATDMWVVGNQGTILHHDGRQLRSFPAPVGNDLTAIAGLGRDDVWAVSEQGEILHWSGRAWSLTHVLPDAMLYTICATADGRILLGGTRQVNDSWRTAIWRFDGGTWRLMPVHADPSQTVRRIWEPGVGMPVMAATTGSLYYLADQTWWESPTAARIRGTSQDLVLFESHDQRLRQGFVRPDGGLLTDCFIVRNPGARLLAHSWKLLSTDHKCVLTVNNCMVDTLHTASYVIAGLSVPVVPGPSGRRLFVYGQDAGLTRLTWQDDHTVIASDLTPGPSARLIDQIAGDGRRLMTVDWQGRLLSCEDGVWRFITTPWPLVALTGLDDGTAVVRNRDRQLALLDTTGTWSTLPDCPATFQDLWFDSGRRARAMAFNQADRIWELWRLESDRWDLLDTLSYAYGMVDQIAGSALDDLYVLTAKNEMRWLLHHDGSGWREVFGDIHPQREITIERIAAGGLSGRLYLEGVDAQLGAFGGYLFDGRINALGNQPIFWDELTETANGLTFCRAGSMLYVLGPDGWRMMPGPDGADLRRHWAHADQGLFVMTDRDEIFHHNLSRGRP
jgi:hypothetical protein